MKNKILKIELNGQELFLMAESLETSEFGTAICLNPFDRSNWNESYAHLFPNGKIRRFNKLIGHKRDIKVLAVVDEE